MQVLVKVAVTKLSLDGGIVVMVTTVTETWLLFGLLPVYPRQRLLDMRHITVN
jgi:hypothetical protein